jgi:hypothetical protein
MSSHFAVPQRAPTLQFPEWQLEYQAALFELDRTKLPQRLSVAELVLLNRLDVIAHNEDARKEREKIEDALSKLRLLKNLSCKQEAA